MAKKGGGGFFDNPFGGVFDFNRDGKEDFGEQWLGYRMFEELTKEEQDEAPPFPYDYDIYMDHDDGKDDSWREYCESGIEFGVDPEDYETEEEYEEALEEAKYGWREDVEDGYDFEVDPEDYETKEEYEAALKEAKYGWREIVEDGSAFGIAPEDYETEEEYEDALEAAHEEAKYGWRKTAEAGDEFGLDPEDYETKEAYEAALQEAKYGWRENVKDGYELGLDPVDYETEEEYETALEAAREEAKYGWRRTAEDGDEVGLDPVDYETEEEYKAALEAAREEAKYGWLENVEDGYDFGLDPEDDETEEEYQNALAEADSSASENPDEAIDPSDYPNKRQYQAAVTLHNRFIIYLDEEREKRVKERCRFILDKSNEILAANYLTERGDFLLSQAVKDHFELPVALPSEDEEALISLSEMVQRLSRKNISLAIEVWVWCVEQFLPYAEYAWGCEELTGRTLDELYTCSEPFKKALRIYLKDHGDFRKKMILEARKLPDVLSELIVDLIKDDFADTAVSMFEDGLILSGNDWRSVNQLVREVIFFAKNNDEPEAIEFVEQHFIPKLSRYSDEMILDEMEEWKKDISDYKALMERECDE